MKGKLFIHNLIKGKKINLIAILKFFLFKIKNIIYFTLSNGFFSYSNCSDSVKQGFYFVISINSAEEKQNSCKIVRSTCNIAMLPCRKIAIKEEL